MKCLRCGYCCIQYEVNIVDNPELGVIESNLKAKYTGERCQHLRGDVPGKYSCAVHNYSWYKQTPCYQFGQVELSENDPCRIGEYMLKPENSELLSIVSKGGKKDGIR